MTICVLFRHKFLKECSVMDYSQSNWGFDPVHAAYSCSYTFQAT